MSFITNRWSKLLVHAVGGVMLLGAVQVEALTVSNSQATMINAETTSLGQLQAPPLSIFSASSASSQTTRISGTGGIVYEDVTFVNDKNTSVVSFGDLQSGQYELTLTDFEFPSMLDSLSAIITTATRKIDSLLLEEGVLQSSKTMQLLAGETYYISMASEASNGLGLYGVEFKALSGAPISNVPLPLPAYLFLSGLAVVCLGKRGKLFS